MFTFLGFFLHLNTGESALPSMTPRPSLFHPCSVRIIMTMTDCETSQVDLSPLLFSNPVQSSHLSISSIFRFSSSSLPSSRHNPQLSGRLIYIVRARSCHTLRPLAPPLITIRRQFPQNFLDGGNNPKISNRHLKAIFPPQLLSSLHRVYLYTTKEGLLMPSPLASFPRRNVRWSCGRGVHDGVMTERSGSLI